MDRIRNVVWSFSRCVKYKYIKRMVGLESAVDGKISAASPSPEHLLLLMTNWHYMAKFYINCIGLVVVKVSSFESACNIRSAQSPYHCATITTNAMCRRLRSVCRYPIEETSFIA